MSHNTSMHFGLADQAKLHHLAGNNTRALLYLREAMQVSSNPGQEALFSRYYSYLSIEILEQERHYEDVIEYCHRAIEHYTINPPESIIAQMDPVEDLQRAMAVLDDLDMQAPQHDGRDESVVLYVR